MNENRIVENVKKRQLVLTVTTGRSGTAYLATIFGYARGVTSLHEPSPEYVEILREVQSRPERAKQFLLEKKLPAILETKSDVYIETSHLVCKGFLEPLLELGVVPDLIIHRRPARDVAISMHKMGTIPGRSDKGLRFYLSPDDPGVLSLENWQVMHDYQLCYWYCLEIERRAQYYKRLFSSRNARVVETSLAGLKTYAGLKECFVGLGLKPRFPEWLTNMRFTANSTVKVNESKETKKEVDPIGNIDEMEQEVVARSGTSESISWPDEFAGRGN